jgi:hypothetical protein
MCVVSDMQSIVDRRRAQEHHPLKTRRGLTKDYAGDGGVQTLGNNPMLGCREGRDV